MDVKLRVLITEGTQQITANKWINQRKNSNIKYQPTNNSPVNFPKGKILKFRNIFVTHCFFLNFNIPRHPTLIFRKCPEFCSKEKFLGGEEISSNRMRFAVH